VPLHRDVSGARRRARGLQPDRAGYLGTRFSLGPDRGRDARRGRRDSCAVGHGRVHQGICADSRALTCWGSRVQTVGGATLAAGLEPGRRRFREPDVCGRRHPGRAAGDTDPDAGALHRAVP
jgi:hypothetical protein